MPMIKYAQMKQLLQIFFGPGNNISREEVEKKAPFLLEPALEEEPGALILPRKMDEGETLWYLLALDDKKIRAISDLVNSFLGRNYTDFQEEIDSIPRDDFLLKINNITRGHTYVFRGDRNIIFPRLKLLYGALSRQPVLTRETIRPVGRVLRDFYFAVQAGNREMAENHLRYLRDNALLEATNLKFLKVYMLSGLGEWKELMSMPHLEDIIQVRKPAGVTAILIQAVYQTELFPLEEKGDLDEMVSYFKKQVQPRFGMLFSLRTGLKIPQVIKAFMLYAAASEPQNQFLRDNLMQSSGLPKQDKKFIERLGKLIPPTLEQVEENYGIRAVESLTEGDLEKAYTLALKAPEGIQKAKVLLECAYEMQTIESESQCVQSIQALAREEREKFLSFRRNREFWIHIAGTADIDIELMAVPKDWVEWLDRLNLVGKWKKGLQHAQLLEEETSVDELIHNWGVEKIISCLNYSRSFEAEQELNLALPHLMKFFQRDEQWPRLQLKDVYENIRVLLTLNAEGNDSVLACYTVICEALMELGMDVNAYRTMLSDTWDIWQSILSPHRLDWILDYCDILFIFQCPDTSSRENFIMNFTGRLEELSRRMEENQWVLLELVLTDVGKKDYFEQLYQRQVSSAGERQEEKLLEEFLQGKFIAIYTLTQRVGSRVKETLEKLCPGVKVEVSNDKVGTDKLKNMSKNADYFLISWLSAKHAATEFINAHRPANLPTEYAKGKGSASILRALREAMEI